MLIACWSAKGGAGTTVVTTTLALLAARTSAAGALLVDLGGDVPAVLGAPDPTGPGIAEWLAAGDDVPADALARLERAAAPGLTLLARGTGPLDPARAEVLGAVLASEPRPVFADCGIALDGASLAVALAADRSILVIRPCYLALRRAIAAPLRPSQVVLVREHGRALTAIDVEAALDAPVVTTVDVDPAIARAVDAGLLLARMPRLLERGLRDAA
jgi:MinD-like ATPase involved in chromosome partitioning or flagellar assembly